MIGHQPSFIANARILDFSAAHRQTLLMSAQRLKIKGTHDKENYHKG